MANIKKTVKRGSASPRIEKLPRATGGSGKIKKLPKTTARGKRSSPSTTRKRTYSI